MPDKPNPELPIYPQQQKHSDYRKLHGPLFDRALAVVMVHDFLDFVGSDLVLHVNSSCHDGSPPLFSQ
jgi:hypothetical protein